jgi:integrase
MPRLTKRIPKYGKHSASGQAVVCIHGKDYYLGPWRSLASRAEYDRLIAEYLASGRQNVAAGEALTVVELSRQFKQHVNAYYIHADGTPTSEGKNFVPPLDLLVRLYGTTPASTFGPLALEAIRLKMIELGWCRSNINRHIARIKMMFKWAVAKQLIPASVHHALTAVAGLRAGRSDAKESEPVKPVDSAVVDATLDHLSSVIAGMVQVQRLTGARPGEVCNMRTADIDQIGKVWVYKPVSHKTAHHGHQRTIFVGPKAQEVLRPFLKPLNPTAFIFSPKDAVAERAELLHEARLDGGTPLNEGNRPGTNRVRKPRRQAGDFYTSTAYARAISRAADSAELWAKGGLIVANDKRLVPHWHPHQLRHSAATEIRRQFGIEAAQTILGHATLSVTQVYAEKNAEAGQRIAAAIG